ALVSSFLLLGLASAAAGPLARSPAAAPPCGRGRQASRPAKVAALALAASLVYRALVAGPPTLAQPLVGAQGSYLQGSERAGIVSRHGESLTGPHFGSQRSVNPP